MKADFAIETSGNKVIRIGKSEIICPEIQWDKKGIKWFDDTKLIRNHSQGKISQKK